MAKSRIDALITIVGDAIAPAYDVIGLHIEDVKAEQVNTLLKEAKEKLNTLKKSEKPDFFSITVLNLIIDALENELLRECYNKEG